MILECTHRGRVEEMWSVGLLLVAALVIYYTYWINKWRYPKCNGVLPPGSMGLPLVGETLQLFIPSYSLDLHPFIKKRIQRYGPIFRTSVAGRPAVISADYEFNRFLLNQEGRLVEMWYLDTFSKLFTQDGDTTARTNAVGLVHKYIRSITLNHFGLETIRSKLLPQIEDTVEKALQIWSTLASVEVKHASSIMIYGLVAKLMLGSEGGKSAEKLSEEFTKILDGLMSFPLNVPGTAYHKCLKIQQKARDLIKQEMEKRRKAKERRHDDDFLGQAMDDLAREKFLSEELILQMAFAGLFVGFESIASAITLVMKFLADHPSVVRELTAEHGRIIKNRKDPNSRLTWDEYRSMTFTFQVINETLRLGNVSPGLLRKATKDIEYKGYTIPAGWTIMIVTSARQVNPEVYSDPLVFNPWRWNELDSDTISKNFTPFGGGIRQCAGAEYSKAFLATFLHFLVTKYQWTKIKGGVVSRNPVLGFGEGIYIKISKKQ